MNSSNKKSKKKIKTKQKKPETEIFSVSNTQAEIDPLNQTQNEGEDDDSKDSIAEYEKIISEKLEEKRKEELKKASDHMKLKLVKTGRCPICTLAPPCNHYSTTDEILAANRRVITQRKASQNRSPSTSQSPQKSYSGRPAPHRVRKPKKIADRLNRTAYNTDSQPISQPMYSAQKARLGSHERSEDVDDPALPTIKDEDFEKPRDPSIVSKEVKVVDTEHSEDKNISQPAPRRPKNSDANAVYQIRRKRIKQPQTRLYSHQNRTKVRIQGKHGTRTEKYVNIQKSIEEQKRQQERKRYIMKARQRHKIQERIEKYREQKIEHEIELLGNQPLFKLFNKITFIIDLDIKIINLEHF